MAALLHELRLFFVALQFLTRLQVPGWVGYDPDWLNMESTRGDVQFSTQAPAGVQTIDFDLSDPFTDEPVPLPPITQSDLPAVPPTKALEPGQPVGFGASSDRFEVRFELEEIKKPK